MRASLCRLLPAIALALLTSAQAQALQLVEARDGVTVEASISVKEPTRIRLESGSIADVFGNIYSSTCGQGPQPGGSPAAGAAPQVNPLGEVVLECDRDKGEIYVRPIGSGNKPINLFVSSERATYTLLLKRTDTPADTIVIRDKTPQQAQAFESRIPASLSGRSPVHIRALKTMLIAMATDRVETDIRVEEIGRNRFRMIRR